MAAMVGTRVPRGVPALLQSYDDEDELSSLLLLQLRRRGMCTRRAESTAEAPHGADAAAADASAADARSYDGPFTHPTRSTASSSSAAAAAAAAAVAATPRSQRRVVHHRLPGGVSPPSSSCGSTASSASDSGTEAEEVVLPAALLGDPGVAMDATGYLTPKQLTRLVKHSQARQATHRRTVAAAGAVEARYRVARHFARRRLAAGAGYGAPAAASTVLYNTMLEANHRRQQQYLDRRLGGGAGADGSDTCSSGGDAPAVPVASRPPAATALAAAKAATARSPPTVDARPPQPRKQAAAATERLAKLLPIGRRTARGEGKRSPTPVVALTRKVRSVADKA